MRGFTSGRLMLAVLLCAIVPATASAGQRVTSTMRNVTAVMSANGFHITPYGGRQGTKHPGDEATSQYFQVVRPDNRELTIGRLYTSCTCVTITSEKRTFAPGEPALFEMRNVRPTPASGQSYAIYIQVTKPIRTTLRYDFFLQSDRFKPEMAAVPVLPYTPPSDPIDFRSLDGKKPSDDDDDVPASVAAEAAAEAAAAQLAAKESEPEASAVEAVAAAAPAESEPEPEPAAPAEATEPEAVVELREKGIPPQTISLITLGVKDLKRTVAFYRDLGWAPIQRESFDHIAFFQLNGQVLCLYPVEDLVREQNMHGAKPSPGGVTLALHVPEKDEVEMVYRKFVDAGGTVLRKPETMASGAMTGYIADPEGNAWEISWVPHFKVGPKGELWLP